MILAALLLAISSLPPTDGWDAAVSGSSWPRTTNSVWRAPFAAGAEAFDVDRRDGAEGEVTFRTDGIRIVKTNSRGAIVVRPRLPFRNGGGSTPRVFAEVREVDGDPMRSLGFLRLWSGPENLTIRGEGAYGPSPLNHFLVSTPPGGSLRKLALPPAESAAGPDFTPAIVVAGAPSTSVWSDWGAEGVDDADRVWKKYKGDCWRKGVRDHSREVSPAEMFERALAADRDHTAKVVKKEGFARLLIDGQEAPPVFYKGYGGPFAYCGQRMEEKADLRLQVAGITFGGRVTNDPGIRPHWTRAGFDVTGAVERVRHYMRAAPNSLFLLGISVNPYPEFADDHPSERWIGPDGKPVRGRGCIVAWDQAAAAKDPQAWNLVSQFSPLWREEVKRHLAVFVDELRRTGLAKRIVGVHASGSHDGQFGMPLYDYSPHARNAYRAFLRNRYGDDVPNGSLEPPAFARYGDAAMGPDFLVGPENRDLVDFQEFIHHASVDIQEDIARHVKACFGKDIIAVKYCLSVFAGLKAGEFDFTRLLNSDVIDVFAAQSCYKRRPPGIPIPEKRVTASLHEHGKLFVSELDFEAFHRGPSFCRDEFAAMSWGYLPDYPSWESANHKAVGQMLAQRQGFWYYDMGGDYFDDDRQLADIRRIMETTRRLVRGRPSAWRPSAAFVIDERGMMFRNISRGSHGTIVDERDSMAEQLALLEMSGAPFDTYLMDDFLRKPELAERYRTVVLAGAYSLDAPRRELVARLCRAGRTVVLGSGAGIAGGAAEIGFALDVLPRQKAPGHEIVPAAGYADEEVKGFFETEAIRIALGAKPGGAKYAERRPHRVSVRPADGQETIATYAADDAAAIVSRRKDGGRLVYVCDQMGLTPRLFNRLVRESGGYVCGEAGRVQVDMNGDFIAVHGLRGGRYDLELPFAATVTNLKSGRPERTEGRKLPLELTPGRSCWFSLKPLDDGKLDADVWPAVTPETKVVTESQVRPVGPYWRAKVALTNEMTKRFVLKAKPVESWIQFGGPGTTCFVNGEKIARNGYFRDVVNWDVRGLLKTGTNEVRLVNESKADWAKWTIGELFERQPDGSYEKICLGDELPDNLKGSGPTMPPYEGAIRLAYTDLAHPQQDVSATAEPAVARGGDPVRFTFAFSGDTLPEFPFDAQLVYRVGKAVRWTDRLLVTEKEIVRREGRNWTLRLERKTPRYLALKDAQVKLESCALFRIGARRLAAAVTVEPPACDPAFPKPVRATVARVAGQPVFALDGRPFFAFWGGGSGNRPDFTRRHSDAPLNLMTMGPSSNVWWPKTDVFDFSAFDRAAEELSVHNPDAYFMANLSIYPPPDWCAANPDEMACDAEGKTCTSWFGTYSFSSRKALDLIEGAMEKAIAYLERSPYANRIIGYRINSGNTVEWLGWDPPRGGRHPLDFSAAERRGFGRPIPDGASRAADPAGELLWEERDHREAVAYHRYVSDTVADDLIRMCGRAKTLLGGRKLVGTYYGYVMTLWSGGVEQMRGHYSLKKVIDSKAVDFLMSPQPYTVRNLGDAYGDMKPFRTLEANGIVSVLEDDTRTFSSRRLPPSMEDNLQMPTEKTTVGALRRNLGFTLCRRQILYYIPLCSGMEFDFPQFAADAAEARRIGEKCLAEGVARRAEIAVVMSEETIKAMPVLRGLSTGDGTEMQIYRGDGSVKRVSESGTPFAIDPFCFAYTRYARLGAPVDYVLAEDLKDHPGEYKLYLFVNCYRVDDAFRAAVERLRHRACTLVWLSAPGYLSPDGNSVEAMERLTGFSFAKRSGRGQPQLTMADGRTMGARGSAVAPLFSVAGGEPLGFWEDGTAGAAVTKTGAATSVYCGTFQTDLRFLREQAARAGVHVYADSEDPVEANDCLVCLHARRAGEKTIRLPRRADVYDVFNRKTVAKGVTEFSFTAPLHSSWLFHYR